MGADWCLRSDIVPDSRLQAEGSKGTQDYLVDVAARLKSTITALLAEVEEHDYTSSFERLQDVGVEQTSEMALLEVHELKNRYDNVLAYDHSRVVLPLSNDDPTTDYVNANFIDGYYRPQAYIAAQGPVPNSFAAFWRMVWHCNVSVIVMTTQEWEDGRQKCDRYWPDPTSTPAEKVKNFGLGLSVHHLETTHYEYWVTRTFKIKYTGWQREVTQICYTAWPDHGVPESADEVLLLRLEVHRLAETSIGPTVVHCSAGVGRTGTYIALDRLLDRCTNADGQLDVEGCVADMRMSRNMMVQTEPQYLFIYGALLHAVNTLLTIERAGGRSCFNGGSREYDSVKGARRSLSLEQPDIPDASTDSPTWSAMHYERPGSAYASTKWPTMDSEGPGSMLTTSSMSSTVASESTLMLNDSKTSIRFKSTRRSNPIFQNNGASIRLSVTSVGAARPPQLSSSTDHDEPITPRTVTTSHGGLSSFSGRSRSQSYGDALKKTSKEGEDEPAQMFVAVNKVAPTLRAARVDDDGVSNEIGAPPSPPSRPFSGTTRTQSYGDALEVTAEEGEDDGTQTVNNPAPTLRAPRSRTCSVDDDDGVPPPPPPRPSLGVTAVTPSKSKVLNPRYVLPPQYEVAAEVA